MVKRISLYIILALFLALLPAAGQQTSSGKELPRTSTISYPSEDDVVLGLHTPSLYFQPLTPDNWEKRNSSDGDIYKQTYKVPFAWAGRQIFLFVGYAPTAYEVYVNGKQAAVNTSPRVASEFDVTNFSSEGINEVEIKLLRDDISDQLMEDAPSAGFGEVYIMSQPKVRVRDYVINVLREKSLVTAELGVIVKSHFLNTKDYRLYYKLYSPNGDLVSESYRDLDIEMRREDTIRFAIPLKEAFLWSHETPNLYTLVLYTRQEGRFLEYISYRIGLRQISSSGGNLNINGYPVKLHISTESITRDDYVRMLRRLKSEGYNAVRIPLDANTGNMLKAADEAGIYTVVSSGVNTSRFGESRTIGGNPSNNPSLLDLFIEKNLSPYYFSKGHPSVAAVSIAEMSGNGYNLYESYIALKKSEKHIPVIYPGATGEWNTDALESSFAAGQPQTIGSRFLIDFDKGASNYVGRLYDILTDDPSTGNLHVRNNTTVSPMYYTVAYIIRKGKNKLDEGTIDLAIEPGESEQLNIPLERYAGVKNINYEVSFPDRKFSYKNGKTRIY